MNFERYLKRINYSGPLKPDLSTLDALQEHHVFNVPFENLDICSGIPIRLESELLYDKIVLHKRGGYCYELNALFHRLLLHLGFNASLISARMARGKKCGPEFGHLAILVLIGGQHWLTDVGYGDFSFRPLPVGVDQSRFDGRNHYASRLSAVDGFPCWSVSKWNAVKKKYQEEYFFTKQSHKLEDFEAMNLHQQTSPESHFTQNLICSLPTKQGRVSLINNRLIVTVGSVKQETRLEYAELPGVLESCFGIQVSQNGATDQLFPLLHAGQFHKY